MGGSSSQTVGYKYFAGLQVVIGNCIEKLIAIRPDNRKWIAINSTTNESVVINEPNLFGGDKGEGGFQGVIDVHLGADDQLQNPYLASKDSPIVSAYPNLSYLVYRGASGDKGFQLVSMSGMLKDVLYWPKRIHIKDDGSPQWYDEKSEILDYTILEDFEDFEFSDFSILTTRTTTNGFQIETIVNYNSDLANFSPVKIGGGTGVSSQKYFEGYESENQSFVNTSEYDLYVRVVASTIGQSTSGNIDSILKIEPGGVFDIISWCSNSKYDTETNTYVMGVALDVYFLYVERHIPDQYGLDINPIHKIREIITDDTAMNKPEAMINDANFKAAAARVWEEMLGVSGAFTEKSCKEAIDELLYHIEAGIRVNRQTGLYEIVLFRDDLLDLDNAQLFDKSNIKTFSIETANIDDVINSVNVNYYDRDNIKDSSFSLDELGSILSNQPNAETLDFPYFMNRRNAELVGNWKLKQLSTPTRKGSFTTGSYDARKINRYDVVKLTWHNQNMIEVPIRIMKIGLGDGRDNTVTLDWVEVIPYSSIVFPTINVDPPTSVVLPPQPNESIAFEMPYLEAVQRFGQTQVDTELANNPDFGYLMVATKKPQNNSINALLFTDNGTGYQQASIVDYCPVVQLDQDISYLDTSFAVKNVSSISQAEVGTLILCDEELMVYQSYDTETKILTVKRAALDTVPKPHLQDAVFYFYDAFSAFDSEQYVLSEVIDAKVLTTTPSGIQELGDVTALSVEMDARPIRPYPPANVKINDEYYPIEIETDLVVTWVDRNRLQQTGGSILGWTDGSVALESGVTYHLELYNMSASAEVFNSSIGTVNTYAFTELTAADYRLRLYSVRDSYSSYQIFEHIFHLRTLSKLTQEDDVSFILQESGDFILLEQ